MPLREDHIDQILVAPMSRDGCCKYLLALEAALFVVDDQVRPTGFVLFVDQDRRVGIVFRAVQMNAAQISSLGHGSNSLTGAPASSLCHFMSP